MSYSSKSTGVPISALMQHLCELQKLEDKAKESDASKTTQLTKEIIRHFIRNRQPDRLFFRKMELRDALYDNVQHVFPRCGLYLIGSSMNGFGTNCSDMDICLMIQLDDLDQRTEAVRVLSVVSRVLQNLDWVRSQQLIVAKVPILRIQFGPPYEDIQVDLNVNNSVAIKNTHLLFYYSKWDWRVRPLALIVKEWAKRQGINDASRSTISSYSLTLMLIHYLQNAEPPVLPCLHKHYRVKFNSRVDVRKLNITEELNPCPSDVFETKNTQSVADLLLGFLHYYAYDFNFDNWALSVRLGSRIPKVKAARTPSPYNHPSLWRCICVEEPFTLSNAAHSVYNDVVFEGVKQVFRRSYEQLSVDQRLYVLLASGSCSLPGVERRPSVDSVSTPIKSPRRLKRRDEKDKSLSLSVSALFGQDSPEKDDSGLIPAVRMLMGNSTESSECTVDSGFGSELSTSTLCSQE